ncbi:MAG: hypothetical protein WCL32_08155 [Planctomycetota bacterium]|jgi:hypothetical protein
MLTQEKADALMAMVKALTAGRRIDFPVPGSDLRLEAKSEDGREVFAFDVNRKLGKRIRISKCTMQERYAGVEILLRLDIDGPPHDNPDGQTIPCPHLHIYKEGEADKWAYPLPPEVTDPTNLERTLLEFLKYCKVKDDVEVMPSLPLC